MKLHLLFLLLLGSFTSIITTFAYEPVQCPPPSSSPSSSQLDPLIIKGKRFFDSITGEYVPIKGIAYYPRPNSGILARSSNNVDFFIDEYQSLWENDILNHLQPLGVNVIRIYGINPTLNHTKFMCTLHNVGIYVIIGLLADCNGCNIVGGDETLEIPSTATPPNCYPMSLKRRGQLIINEFSKYTNTLAFSAGNEVTLYSKPHDKFLNAPCQKKFLSDMRYYIRSCRQTLNSALPRSIPIGMVNWDYQRDIQTLYFNCREEEKGDDTLLLLPEWYGINSYQHCNGAAKSIGELDGWIKLKDDFQNYNLPIPIIISEFGCRERNFQAIDVYESQRNWLQIDALYDTANNTSLDYTNVFAGGIVFEYSSEKVVVETSAQSQPWPFYKFMKLNYGIGYYSPKDCEHYATKTNEIGGDINNDNQCVYNRYPEFDILQEKLNSINQNTHSYPSMDEYQIDDTIVPPICPTNYTTSNSNIIMIRSPLEFDWPTDEDFGIPCPVIETSNPTTSPTTTAPTNAPSTNPTIFPTNEPTTGQPSIKPSTMPSTSNPSSMPSSMPSEVPSSSPTEPRISSTPSSFSSSQPTTAGTSDTTTNGEDDTQREVDENDDDGSTAQLDGNTFVSSDAVNNIISFSNLMRLSWIIITTTMTIL